MNYITVAPKIRKTVNHNSLQSQHTDIAYENHIFCWVLEVNVWFWLTQTIYLGPTVLTMGPGIRVGNIT
jgi:hypothetical protein